MSFLQIKWLNYRVYVFFFTVCEVVGILTTYEFENNDKFLNYSMLHEICIYFLRVVTYSFHIVTCTPIARQRIGKQVPAKIDSC
jgi:hypothetical protein